MGGCGDNGSMDIGMGEKGWEWEGWGRGEYKKIYIHHWLFNKIFLIISKGLNDLSKVIVKINE